MPDLQPAGESDLQPKAIVPNVIKPLYTVLGYLHGSWAGAIQVALEVRGGEVRIYRISDFQSLPTLLDLYPDLSYWIRLFPKNRYGHRISLTSALAWFMSAAKRAGLYDLESRPYVYYFQRGRLKTKAYT